MTGGIRIIFVFLLIMSVVFCVHLATLYFLGYPLWDNLLVLAYVLNFIMGAGIFYLLYHFRNRFANAMGFLFMGGSLVKFAVFFIVFYPSYKADGNTSTLEFTTFFIPYVVSLAIETYFSSKMLNKMGE